MYKDFKSTIITGGIGSGKTHFIKKYINEIINDDCTLILVDPKMVELHEYKNKSNVEYFNTIEEFINMVYNKIIENNIDKKKIYLFIDEISELVYDEKIKKQIKFMLKNRELFNCELILTSQLKNSFCPGMRRYAKTIIQLN